MYSLVRPILFMMKPEKAHDFTLSAIKMMQKTQLLPLFYGSQFVPTTCMGINLPNPVGLAAGLDKNGAYIDALAELGFGFLEVGTVTPKPQSGNPSPRLFRIKQAGAIINRMGFNNDGVDALVNNINRSKFSGVLGINIGKNATTPVENALDDYVVCLQKVYAHASYITINISSPNTKNLRTLQDSDALAHLLDGIKNCHAKLATAHGFYVPIALKIAPDLQSAQIDDISRRLIEFEIDGLIATNTTITRVGVESHSLSQESGGLSGRPMCHVATKVLQDFYAHLQGKVDIIGAGGIDEGELAISKIKAGASAVQLYTGLIYRGPALIGECVQAINNYQDTLQQSGLDGPA